MRRGVSPVRCPTAGRCLPGLIYPNYFVIYCRQWTQSASPRTISDGRELQDSVYPDRPRRGRSSSTVDLVVVVTGSTDMGRTGDVDRNYGRGRFTPDVRWRNSKRSDGRDYGCLTSSAGTLVDGAAC